MLTIVMLFVLITAYLLMFGTVRLAENLITRRQPEFLGAAGEGTTVSRRE